MGEIPVIQIYLWGNLVGAMSWDDESCDDRPGNRS